MSGIDAVWNLIDFDKKVAYADLVVGRGRRLDRQRIG